jgi:hypothetical protein
MEVRIKKPEGVQGATIFFIDSNGDEHEIAEITETETKAVAKPLLLHAIANIILKAGTCLSETVQEINNAKTDNPMILLFDALFPSA